MVLGYVRSQFPWYVGQIEIRPDSWIVGKRKGTSGCEMPSLRKLSSSLVKVGDAPARTLAIFHFHPFSKVAITLSLAIATFGLVWFGFALVASSFSSFCLFMLELRFFLHMSFTVTS